MDGHNLTRRSFVGGSALLAAMLATPSLALASSGLDGYDISGAQGNIDIASIPADFVIVKATEGTTFTSDYFVRDADAVLAANKLLGIYHYARGNIVAHEVTNFVNAVGPYIGRAVFVLDWESGGNDVFGTGEQVKWIAEFVAGVKSQTGVEPIVYVQASEMYSIGVDASRLWVAQYGSYNTVWGYEANPWNEGAYSCLMRQYTSSGRLDGYGGSLDLDRFYGSRADWLALAEGATITYLSDDTEDGMIPDCIINFNNSGQMVWFCAGRLHWLDEPDTMTAVQKLYHDVYAARAANPGEIPVLPFGTPEAPWASRLAEAVYDGSAELSKFTADHPESVGVNND